MADESFHRWNRTKTTISDKQTCTHSLTYDSGQCVNYSIEVSNKVKKTNRYLDDCYFARKTVGPERGGIPMKNLSKNSSTFEENLTVNRTPLNEASRSDRTNQEPISMTSTSSVIKDVKVPTGSSDFLSCSDVREDQDPHVIPTESVVENDGSKSNRIIFRAPVYSVSEHTEATPSCEPEEHETRDIGIGTSDFDTSLCYNGDIQSNLTKDFIGTDMGIQDLSCDQRLEYLNKPDLESQNVCSNTNENNTSGSLTAHVTPSKNSLEQCPPCDASEEVNACNSFLKKYMDYREAWNRFYTKRENEKFTIQTDLSATAVSNADFQPNSINSPSALSQNDIAQECDLKSLHDMETLTDKSDSYKIGRRHTYPYLVSEVEQLDAFKDYHSPVAGNDVGKFENENESVDSEIPRTPCPSSTSERLEQTSVPDSGLTFDVHTLFSVLLDSGSDVGTAYQGKTDSNQVKKENDDRMHPDFCSLLSSDENTASVDLETVIKIIDGITQERNHIHNTINKIKSRNKKIITACEKIISLVVTEKLVTDRQMLESIEKKNHRKSSSCPTTPELAGIKGTENKENGSACIPNQSSEYDERYTRLPIGDAIMGCEERREIGKNKTSRTETGGFKTFQNDKNNKIAGEHEKIVSEEGYVKNGSIGTIRNNRKQRRNRKPGHCSREQPTSGVQSKNVNESVVCSKSHRYGTTDKTGGLKNISKSCKNAIHSISDVYFYVAEQNRHLDEFLKLTQNAFGSGGVEAHLSQTIQEVNDDTYANTRNIPSETWYSDSSESSCNLVSHEELFLEPEHIGMCMNLRKVCFGDMTAWLNVQPSRLCEYHRRTGSTNVQGFDDRLAGSHRNAVDENLLTSSLVYQRGLEFSESMAEAGVNDGETDFRNDFMQAFRQLCSHMGVQMNMLRCPFTTRLCLFILGIIIMHLVHYVILKAK